MKFMVHNCPLLTRWELKTTSINRGRHPQRDQNHSEDKQGKPTYKRMIEQSEE